MIWEQQAASYRSPLQVSTHYAQQWTQNPSPLRRATEENSAVRMSLTYSTGGISWNFINYVEFIWSKI
jgi:hypothetical protein